MSHRLLLLLVCLFTLATVMTTLAGLQPAARLRVSERAESVPPSQLEEEEYAVYSALINNGLKEGDAEQKREEGRVLIINESTSLWQGFIADESKNFFEELKRSSPELQPETVNDLQVKSNGDSRLERRFTINTKYALVSDEELEGIFKEGVGGWEAFHRKYPKSRGFLTLSRVGFNADKTQALVYQGWSCGGLCGGGGYTLLAKKNGVWIVVRDVGPTWVS